MSVIDWLIAKEIIPPASTHASGSRIRPRSATADDDRDSDTGTDSSSELQLLNPQEVETYRRLKVVVHTSLPRVTLDSLLFSCRPRYPIGGSGNASSSSNRSSSQRAPLTERSLISLGTPTRSGLLSVLGSLSVCFLAWLPLLDTFLGHSLCCTLTPHL